MVEHALQEGKRVVVDNTNPTREVRARYIQAAARTARRTGRSAIPARCVFVLADPIVCKHNNNYRAYMANKDSDGIWMQKETVNQSTKSSGKIPDIAFRSFYSRFEEPTTAEGFTEVLKVAFSPTFETEEEEKLWCMHWT
jgi:bifunctional polynucleotide phosphatase/kinase